MKSAELKVVLFDTNDVIATSGVCSLIANGVGHVYVNNVGYNEDYEGDAASVTGYMLNCDPSPDTISLYSFSDNNPQIGKWYYYDYGAHGYVICTSGSHDPADFSQ